MSKTEITKQQLRDSIPAHCFEKSNLTSFSYLLGDISIIALLYYLSGYISLAPKSLQPIIWFLWTFAQGVIMTGVWVLAHECGHQAFSPSTLINDTVGWFCHSFLLVPYFAWKISHASHHAYTGNFDRDEVFVPQEIDSAKESFIESFTETPIGNLLLTIVVLLIGWPYYLIANASSNAQFKHLRANHFEPESPIFKPRHRKLIILSNIGVLLMISGLIYMTFQLGFKSMLLYYFIPYLWVNAWLVTITFLQHTSKDIIYYKHSEWNFVKGAVQTIDRDYGIFNGLLHHISDTHVCHHFFHQIPHYHAQEATKHMTKLLGDSYLHDETPFYIAL
eukprot:gene9972-2291_t